MEESREKPRSFKEVINLDCPITVKEAIKILGDFHKTSDKAIEDTFVNLRDANKSEGCKIIFKKGKNSGWDCIVMECYDKDNKRQSWDYLDEGKGTPMNRCG